MNKCILHSIAAVFVFLTDLKAEVTVKLLDQNRLTGQLITFSSTGNTTFLPVGFTSPVRLKPNTVTEINFKTDQASSSTLQSELITLHNGDSLGCSITSFDADFITFDTPFAKELKVPKALVTKIKFNHNTPLTSTPKNLAWQVTPNWNIQDNIIRGKGAGHINSRAELSQNFMFSFDTRWASHQPKFEILFCANANNNELFKDGYRLEFSRNKANLYRHSIVNPHNKLGEIYISQQQRTKKYFTVRAKVDRINRRIQLTVGDKTKVFEDHAVQPPLADQFTILSKSKSQNEVLIYNFSLLNWNEHLPMSELFSLDEIDPSVDTLIDSVERGKFTGSLSHMEKDGDIRLLHFNHTLTGRKILIPFSKAHTLTLKKEKHTDLPPSHYKVRLADESTLVLSALHIEGKQAQLEHPILGKLTVAAPSLKQLTVIPEQGK